MSYEVLSNGVVTSVDCQKQVRSWRLLRSLIHLLIPSCNCASIEPIASASITGTIFGFRRGKVSLCLQSSSISAPMLLLEFAVPTAVLAREMQTGVLRIALECNATAQNSSLLGVPLWTMYCNGRKAGFAVKRRPSKVDTEALRLMSPVVVGAGVISGKQLDTEDELMYLRANFARVSGSSQAESFHLIDPDGGTGQELSIFFFRSNRT